MIKLMVTSSLWGNIYRHQYFLNGRRCSKVQFDHYYILCDCTPENGVNSKTSYGYKKIWQAKI